MNRKTRPIDPQAPDPVVLGESVRLLRHGGLLVVPTRHLYGLGVDALNPRAVARVFAAKQRSPRRPLLILVPSRAALRCYAAGHDVRAEALMDAFWPGKVTIVLQAGPAVPSALTGGSGRIGIRVPEHPVCRALVKELGRPITATSANLSGRPGVHCVADLDPALAAEVDLILDAGPLLPGLGSTVVDIRSEGVTVLREGAVSRDAIGRVLGCEVSSAPAPPGSDR